VNLATDEKVSVKSSLGICEKPLATILALNLIRQPCPSNFSLKTIRDPTAFFPFGIVFTHSKTPAVCN